MFDKTNLIVLREKANNSENLINMMRNYKVPIGMTDEEMERANEYFKKSQE
jgi:hypothetical protein